MAKVNISQSLIEQQIRLIRGQKVMLDCDLATLYGVSTKVLNQAVSRNKVRFPSDFCFRLMPEEAGQMRSQIVTASKRNLRFTPYAFTEHGALMAANLLKSPRAAAMSVYVIRAFVRLREVFVMNQIFEKKQTRARHSNRGQATLER